MWACERGVFVNVGPQNGEMCCSGRGFGFCVFVVICMSFLFSIEIVAMCVLFLYFCVFDAMRMFLMVFADSPQIVAICSFRFFVFCVDAMCKVFG